MSETALPLPPRGGARPSASPALGWAAFALLALAPFAGPMAGDAYLASLVARAMILALAAISLDLLIGRAGLVSLGHAAFVGIGAYAAGIGLAEGIEETLVLLALAVAAAAAFALVTGAVALRTTGVHFIMITLAFGQMLFFATSALAQYGGDDGMTLWSTSTLLGTGVMQGEAGLHLVILAALAGGWWLAGRLAASRFGRVLAAAKEAPTRVATLGMSPYAHRLAVYVVAGAIAGVAGFLLAHETEFVSPAAAAWQRSGDLIIVVLLGGMGTRNGALIGAFAFVALEEALAGATEHWRLLFGPFLIAVVLFARGGLAAALDRLTARA